MAFLKTIALASFLTITASANAALFSFDVNPVTGGAFGNDKISEITTSFDSTNQRFTWNASPKFPSPTLSDPNVIDGFWLVVNNGPNPKRSDVNELAIMYGDLDRGILSTYVYNGEGNARSIVDPGILLQTDTLTRDLNGTFSFDISTAAINGWAPSDPLYTGIAFGPKIGIWFHFSSGSTFTYNNNGDIIDYSYTSQGWYDVGGEDALQTSSAQVSVSAPSVITLFGLALAGLTLIRRKAS